MNDNELPDFTGKTLVIRHGSDPSDGTYLENASFQRQADRLFLTGTVPAMIPGYGNRFIAVAWDEVRLYYVFDSPRDCQCAMRDSTRANTKTLWRRFTDFMYGERWY